jgi:tRNA(adenine34) deaminase
MSLFPYQLTPSNDDEKWMLYALKEAWKAYQDNEIPIGAVLVLDNRIIAKGHNQVELLKDATAHAEMLCLTSASGSLSNWRLLNTTLYSTVEPCTMCAGAMFLSRIKRLVWGTHDTRHGANGSWVNLFEKKHPMHSINVSNGIYKEVCAELLKSFFKSKREKQNGAHH